MGKGFNMPKNRVKHTLRFIMPRYKVSWILKNIIDFNLFALCINLLVIEPVLLLSFFFLVFNQYIYTLKLGIIPVLPVAEIILYCTIVSKYSGI